MTELSSELLDQLAKQYGVTPERARYLMGGAKVDVVRVASASGSLAVVDYGHIDPRRLDFPIRLVLPWSALVSENRRFCARGNSIFMTPEYRAAREKMVAVARAAMTLEGLVFQPLAQPLALVARVWFPDNRIHDAPNFAGATHNALKKIVFVDDRWLHDVRWLRAGVDVDAPRAEIELRLHE